MIAEKPTFDLGTLDSGEQSLPFELLVTFSGPLGQWSSKLSWKLGITQGLRGVRDVAFSSIPREQTRSIKIQNEFL